MSGTGRRWLLAAPVALVVGLGTLPLVKGSVDDALAGQARAALASAGVSGVTVTSDWAAIRLSGPAELRAPALAAVRSGMSDSDAVDRVDWVGAGSVVAAPTTPSPTPTPSPSVTDGATAGPDGTPTGSPTGSPAASVVMDVSLQLRGGGDDRVGTLVGLVAGQQRHDRLLAAIRAWAPKLRVDDQLAVADGEPSELPAKAFPTFLRVAGPAAAGLAGTVRVDDRGVTVAGTTTSESTATAINDTVSAAASSGATASGSVRGPVTVAKEKLSTVKGLTGVSFRRGSEQLTKASKKTLDEVAKILRANPGVSVEVQGFTDNKGDAKLNQRLSQRRADEVKKYLVSKGVSKSRLSAKGFGEQRPKKSNATEAGRAANRRIEFVVKES